MSSPPPAIAGDLQLLLTAAASGATDAVVRRLAADGFGDLRPRHGYVFQHLLSGPLPIRELGRRLGMTAQGASKGVIELERLGYVRRAVDADDRRAHLVALTERGLAAIEAGRRARAAVTAEMQVVLGPEGLRDFMGTLERVAAQSGGLARLADRRLRPE